MIHQAQYTSPLGLAFLERREGNGWNFHFDPFPRHFAQHREGIRGYGELGRSSRGQNLEELSEVQSVWSNSCGRHRRETIESFMIYGVRMLPRVGRFLRK